MVTLVCTQRLHGNKRSCMCQAVPQRSIKLQVSRLEWQWAALCERSRYASNSCKGRQPRPPAMWELDTPPGISGYDSVSVSSLTEASASSNQIAASHEVPALSCNNVRDLRAFYAVTA